QALEKFVAVHTGFQPDKYLRSFLRGNNMPHLGLSSATGGLFARLRVGIIRMHLDRELLRRKKEFQQQRKWRSGWKSFAAPIRRHLIPCCSEALPAKWPGGNAAIHSGEPGFADRRLQIGFFREKRCKGPRAPEAWTEDGLDSKRFGLHSLGGGFRARKKSLQAPQTLLDAFNGRRVGQAQIPRCRKSFAGNNRNVLPVKKHPGNLRARFRQRRPPPTIRQVLGNVRERVERASRPLASDARDRAQSFDNAFTPFR